MITLVVITSLALISLAAAVLSSSVFDPSRFGPVSSTIEINGDTPDSLLAAELCKGNIDRDIYEMFVAEKLGLKLI